MRMGGGFGASRPGCSYSGEAVVLAGRMPANWRGDCADLATCQRAVSVTVKQPGGAQRHIVRSFIPAPKRLTSEECRRGCRIK